MAKKKPGERNPFEMSEEERGRMVVWVPPDALIEGKGYRVSYVFENIAGHYPTGNAPEGGDVEPWYWGMTYDEAQAAADDYNLKRLNLDAKEAAIIVMKSMAAGMRGKHAPPKK